MHRGKSAAGGQRRKTAELCISVLINGIGQREPRRTWQDAASLGRHREGRSWRRGLHCPPSLARVITGAVGEQMPVQGNGLAKKGSQFDDVTRDLFGFGQSNNYYK